MEIEIEGKIKSLELKEGDVIIFTITKTLNIQRHNEIGIRLKKLFPNNKALVLTDGSLVLTDGCDIKTARLIN